MKEHILFGVSPFNSKFSEEYIHKMLKWGFDNFQYVDVIHPYEEAKYLLLGAGTKDNRAKKRSRGEYGRVKKFIYDFLSANNRELNFGDIIKFSDFYENDLYHRKYEKITHEYNKYPDFKNICNNQTRKAIEKRKQAINDDSETNEDMVEIGVLYILREAPYILYPSEILGTNTKISVSYYENWNIADYLYNDCREIKPSKNTELLIKDHLL